MNVIKNMKIVGNILHKELPNYKFDKLDLLLFIIHNNIFYIGNMNESGKTLFKHTDKDKVYYDVLHSNDIYYDNPEVAYELDEDNICSDLKSIKELVLDYEKEKR